MCKKHYVAAIKILFALAFAGSAFGMEMLSPTLKSTINVFSKDDVETMKSLLEEKILEIEEDLKLAIDSKVTPLLCAASLNAVKCGAFLIERGANLNPTALKTESCAMLAAANNCVEFLTMLQDKKVNLDEGAEEGITPLHTAIAHDAVNAVRFLLNAGADRKSMQLPGVHFTLPLLHIAAFRGKKKVVELLVDEFKYSVNDKIYLAHDKGVPYYVTPNDLAVMEGQWSVCEALKSRGADSLSHRVLMKIWLQSMH